MIYVIAVIMAACFVAAGSLDMDMGYPFLVVFTGFQAVVLMYLWEDRE